MKRSVFLGYAALEYAVQLEGEFRADWTTPIRHRHHHPWPRPGGCHFYAAAPVARAGGAPELITWVGDDEMGTRYRACCSDQGIGVEGIVSIVDGATPLCFLVYQADGSCGCLIDFGMSARAAMTAEQERLVAAAELICITVGPAAASLRALELIRPAATVAWITKNDPVSFVPSLRETLARRADFIFCNGKERAWVDEVTGDRPPHQAIIQTAGAGSVKVFRAGVVTTLSVDPLTTPDTTGAGDTLAGGTLAALSSGETDIVRAVQQGIDAAHGLLGGRPGAHSKGERAS